MEYVMGYTAGELTTETSDDLQLDMNKVIIDINKICMIIDAENLKNEQFYLNWLDALNKISIRD